MFLSCPMLEKIDLELTPINAFGALTLDFRQQAYLKHIKLQQANCRYYTFQHEVEKYWKNSGVLTVKQTLTLEDAKITPYTMHLAWNTDNKNIEIDLPDCKW